jgi:hypothetical protein
MIVTRQGERLRLVTQPDHARLAAEALALWRTDGLPDHPRRHRLLAAVREHDNGWREADAAPRLDPSGRPVDFREADDALRQEIWLRAVARFADDDPYVALLTAQHAIALHGDRRSREDWVETLAELDTRRTELLARVGVDEDELQADYRWLFLADALSLALCGALANVDQGRWRGTVTAQTVELEPFPLAGATTFQLSCRSIPDRRYHGEADLAADLAAAVWTDLPVRLVPGGRRSPGGP